MRVDVPAAGEVIWIGAGALPGGDGWLVLAPAVSAPLLFPSPGDVTATPVHDAVLAVLDGGGALFFRGLGDRVSARLASAQAVGDSGAGPAAVRPLYLAGSRTSDQEVAAAIWDLVWAGLLTNDTLAPLRTVLGTGQSWAPARRPGGAGGPRVPPPPRRPPPPLAAHAPGRRLPGQPPRGSPAP